MNRSIFFFFQMEPRFGSPTPRWHRPSAEESESLQENSDDGKPSIRVTFYDHEGNFPDGNNKKNSLDYDLRNDPHFAQEDAVFKEQRRDSLKNFLRDDKVDRLFNDRSTKRYACNLRNFNFDPLRSTGTTHGTEEIQPLKPMQLPNRYTLLKPICKRSTETNNQD